MSLLLHLGSIPVLLELNFVLVTPSGYHPWFCHLLHLGDAERQVTKDDHYSNIFLPSEASTSYAVQRQLLDEILPDLPEPISVQPLIEQMRAHAVQAQKRGSLVMIGEVGLDRSFRVPFPGHKADHCGEHAEDPAPPPTSAIAVAETRIATSGEEEMAKKMNRPESITRSKNLTPFRPSMEHQIALLGLQMDLAVELGINVSLHSVKAQGPTLDFLKRFKKKHGAMFIDRVNVDVHSCGGWSVESWVDAEASLCRSLHAFDEEMLNSNLSRFTETFPQPLPVAFDSNIRSHARHAPPHSGS